MYLMVERETLYVFSSVIKYRMILFLLDELICLARLVIVVRTNIFTDWSILLLFSSHWDATMSDALPPNVDNTGQVIDSNIHAS